MFSPKNTLGNILDSTSNESTPLSILCDLLRLELFEQKSAKGAKELSGRCFLVGAEFMSNLELAVSEFVAVG